MSKDYESRRQYLKKQREKLEKAYKDDISTSLITLKIINLDSVDYLFGDNSSTYLRRIHDEYYTGPETYAIDFKNMHPLYVYHSLSELKDYSFKIISLVCDKAISKVDFITIYNYLVNYFNILNTKECDPTALAKEVVSKVYSEEDKKIFEVVSRCFNSESHFEECLIKSFERIVENRFVIDKSSEQRKK